MGERDDIRAVGRVVRGLNESLASPAPQVFASVGLLRQCQDEIMRPILDVQERMRLAFRPLGDIFERHRPWINLLARQAQENEALLAVQILPHRVQHADLGAVPLDAVGDLVRARYAEAWDDVARDLCGFLESYDLPSPCQRTFERACTLHARGEYEAVVCTLFPVIERAYRDVLEIDGPTTSLRNLQDSLGEAPISFLQPLKDPLSVYTVFTEQMYAHTNTLPEGALATHTVPNRHAAMHGFYTYDQWRHSLNMILMAEQVFFLIDRFAHLASEAA